MAIQPIDSPTIEIPRNDQTEQQQVQVQVPLSLQELDQLEYFSLMGMFGNDFSHSIDNCVMLILEGYYKLAAVALFREVYRDENQSEDYMINRMHELRNQIPNEFLIFKKIEEIADKVVEKYPNESFECMWDVAFMLVK